MPFCAILRRVLLPRRLNLRVEVKPGVGRAVLTRDALPFLVRGNHAGVDVNNGGVCLSLADGRQFGRGRFPKRLPIEANVRINVAELRELHHIENALYLRVEMLLLRMDAIIPAFQFTLG